MTRIYTDIDLLCCAVLERRVADGDLPPGDVVCADIKSLDAAALSGYSHIHLFAGIGASPMGFHWAGWPDEPGWSLVTGGFPCQQVSAVGNGEGIGTRDEPTDRSGLFWEMLRVVEIKQPFWVFTENVGALSARGLDRVAGALESVGYGVEALRLGAWAVGAPDERERWWFVCRRNAQAGWRGSAGGTSADAGEASGELGDQPSSRHNGAGQRESRQPGGRVRLSSNGSPGSKLVHRTGPRPQGLLADAWRPQVPESGHAGQRRWPHPRWCITDENGKKQTIPTPQYEWEPPRIFPGTRTVNAQWRLALMGFPLHWLDVPDVTLDGLTKRRSEKQARWWNKAGVVMTGNAQNPRVVEALAKAMLCAVEAIE